MKNNNLGTLQDTVENILRGSADARNNNNVLTWAVFKKFGVKADESWASVVMKLIAHELPSFESITRARRKVVELYPELDADESVRALREQAEEEYKNYARG